MENLQVTLKRLPDNLLSYVLWDSTHPDSLYSKEFKLALRNELLRRQGIVKNHFRRIHRRLEVKKVLRFMSICRKRPETSRCSF